MDNRQSVSSRGVPGTPAVPVRACARSQSGGGRGALCCANPRHGRAQRRSLFRLPSRQTEGRGRPAAARPTSPRFGTCRGSGRGSRPQAAVKPKGCFPRPPEAGRSSSPSQTAAARPLLLLPPGTGTFSVPWLSCTSLLAVMFFTASTSGTSAATSSVFTIRLRSDTPSLGSWSNQVASGGRPAPAGNACHCWSREHSG